MTTPDVAELARGLTEAECGVIKRMTGAPSWGADWFSVRWKHPKLVGAVETRAHCVSYFLTPLGLQVRAYLSQPPKTIGD